MPINKASRSINLPDDLAKKLDVQFLVHSRLAVSDVEQVHHHLIDHLRFLRSLEDQGILQIDGPFFTPDGKNTGNGFYVLRVDNLDEARRIAAEDPLHKAGIRSHSVEPWLQRIDWSWLPE